MLEQRRHSADVCFSEMRASPRVASFLAEALLNDSLVWGCAHTNLSAWVDCPDALHIKPTVHRVFETALILFFIYGSEILCMSVFAFGSNI